MERSPSFICSFLLTAPVPTGLNLQFFFLRHKQIEALMLTIIKRKKYTISNAISGFVTFLLAYCFLKNVTGVEDWRRDGRR
jgi:hypothetical protein